ncbi:MAG: hypothetical protein R3D59_08530 [Paracoccaceae bacterium]
MSDRPDIASRLHEGENLLWQGHPKPGRRISTRAGAIGALFYAAAMALLLFAWWLEIYWGHVPTWHLAVYGVIGTAAFCTFVGLRITLLDRRRARSRDARTAYAITDRRVLALFGPYITEIALGPEVHTELAGGGVNVEKGGASIRFERLSDAKSVHGILLDALGGKR